MRRALVVAALLVGCGSAPSSSGTPEPLVFETYSPPQFTSRDVILAARGSIVVLVNRLSRDAGATWDPSPFTGVDRVSIYGDTVATFTTRLVRYNVASRSLAPVSGAPAYTTARTWRTTPTGQFIVFDPLHNAIARETAGGWTISTLPQPTPTEFDPYITDLESSGSTILVASAWGVYRSIDDGATFERVAPPSPQLGREVVVLPDGRFTLLGGTKTLRFDATGALLGESTGITLDTNDAVACDDNAIVAKGKLSRDAGASWEPLLFAGALTLVVERVGCGAGGYWVLGHSESWGYRLLRYDAAGKVGVVAGNWELDGAVAWSAAGPPIVRTSSELIVAGLAWQDQGPSWSWRELPAKAWSAGATLYGVGDDKFFTSDDAGRTWRATNLGVSAGADDIDAFARGPDGALYLSRFSSSTTAGVDNWRATVWRSTDAGTTWTVVYDAEATREAGKNAVGEVHRFSGITALGEWIATDAISKDGGVTWTATEYRGDSSLSFLSPEGHLVSTRGDLWHVFEAGGQGELVGTWALEAQGQPISASSLHSVAFDEQGFAYVAAGAPYVQVWRSSRSIVRD